MAKIRYYYNTETCKYEPIKATRRAMLWNALAFLSISFVMALGIIYAYRANFTPLKESILRSENDKLKLDWAVLQEGLNTAYNHVEELALKDDHIYRVILDTEPISNTIREGGTGGHNRYETLSEQNLTNAEEILGAYKEVDNLRKKLSIQSKSYDEISSLLSEKEKIWSSRPAIQPVNNKELKRIAGGFNPRRFHPILRKIHPHEGIDFTANIGTPVYATGDGTITAAYYSQTYGNVIFINHGYGYQTRYAHLKKFNINNGESVKRGQVIGYVGNTGRSQGPHLHYEVLFKYKPIDPINFFQRDLDNEEYEKVIELSRKETMPLDY